MHRIRQLINCCLYKTYQCYLSVLLKTLIKLTIPAPHLEKAVSRNWASVHQPGCSRAQKFWQTDRVFNHGHALTHPTCEETGMVSSKVSFQNHISAQTSTLPHQKPWGTTLRCKIRNRRSAGTYFLEILFGWYCKHFRKTILAPTGERSSQQYFTHPFSLAVRVSVPGPRAPRPALTPQPRPRTPLPLPEASCQTAARSHGAATAQAAQDRAPPRAFVLKQPQTSSRKKRLFPQSASQTKHPYLPRLLSAPGKGGTGGS